VDEERMAVSAIKELGQKSDYLNSSHTFKYFREELLDSRMMSRKRWAVWEEEGKKGLLDRAEDQVQKLLANPPAEHLSGTQREKLAQIERRWLEKLK
jgi:trimethylamine:corrinoid methyltransferase-like protein